MAAVLAATAGCTGSGPQHRRPASSDALLRIGVGQLYPVELSLILSVEGLIRIGDDGRLDPWLAEKWSLQEGGRSLLITLRPGISFHDGSPVKADTVVPLIKQALANAFGSTIQDVEAVRAVDAKTIEIRFRKPSPFLLESLEVTIRKAGTSIIGTGPFAQSPGSPTEFVANAGYYLGSPNIGRVTIKPFPSARTAWAELLRQQIDVLYEVGPDALESLETSTSIAVFKFRRVFQYTVVFNASSPALRSPLVRRALNLAVDRAELVRHALNGHGLPSSGPIWSHYWAVPDGLPKFDYDPLRANQMLKSQRVRFTCLIPPDQVYERIALELKRQFEAVNVQMDLQSATLEQIAQAQRDRSHDAVLVDRIAGSTMFRLQQAWDSKSPSHPGEIGNTTIDAAFDRVRAAETDADYRRAVAGVQQAFMDDPPAIFLAWSERARAVSKRFEVPAPEPGRDVVSTLRLWTSRNDERLTSRN